MCSGSPCNELDWACDECFGRYQEHSGVKDGDFEFCEECKEVMERRCFCCNITFDSPNDVEDGMCKGCRDTMHEEVPIRMARHAHDHDPGNCMTGGACPICTANDEEERGE
jgi:hypothetical protein